MKRHTPHAHMMRCKEQRGYYQSNKCDETSVMAMINDRILSRFSGEGTLRK